MHMSSITHIQDGSILVGSEALKASAAGSCREASSTFYSVKRLIGRQYKEVQDMAGKLSYQVGLAAWGLLGW